MTLRLRTLQDDLENLNGSKSTTLVAYYAARKETKYARSTGHDSRCYDIPTRQIAASPANRRRTWPVYKPSVPSAKKTVTAFTILSDNDLKPLLDRNEEVLVRHAFGSDRQPVCITSGVSAIKRNKISAN